MEDLIPFLVVIGYLVVNFLGKFVGRRKGDEPEVEADTTSVDQMSVDQMLRDMMRQAGFEQEQPVASEHRRTASEHQQTASEHRATLAERRPTSSEHFRSVTEVFPTRSEHLRTASEHQLSAGEHLKGDAHLPPVPTAEAVPTAGSVSTITARSRFGQDLVADLRGGARPLAKAFVLNEILGPPVALKQ